MRLLKFIRLADGSPQKKLRVKLNKKSVSILDHDTKKLVKRMSRDKFENTIKQYYKNQRLVRNENLLLKKEGFGKGLYNKVVPLTITDFERDIRTIRQPVARLNRKEVIMNALDINYEARLEGLKEAAENNDYDKVKEYEHYRQPSVKRDTLKKQFTTGIYS